MLPPAAIVWQLRSQLQAPHLLWKGKWLETKSIFWQGLRINFFDQPESSGSAIGFSGAWGWTFSKRPQEDIGGQSWRRGRTMGPLFWVGEGCAWLVSKLFGNLFNVVPSQFFTIQGTEKTSQNESMPGRGSPKIVNCHSVFGLQWDWQTSFAKFGFLHWDCWSVWGQMQWASASCRMPAKGGWQFVLGPVVMIWFGISEPLGWEGFQANAMRWRSGSWLNVSYRSFAAPLPRCQIQITRGNLT